MATSKANAGKRALTSDTRIEAAISLLAALTSAPDGRVHARSACFNLGLQPTQLDEVIGLLQLLADRHTGTRLLIYRESDDTVLAGTAGALDPLRLTQEEAMAVSSVLARYRLDASVRDRVTSALMPPTASHSPEKTPILIAGDTLFGGYYQQLIEAQQDGVRVRIAYRADHDARATERTVDPGFIEVSGDAAYLIAWDIEKDAQRRYRLDRVASVELTDDSVVAHPFQRTSPAESLRATGATAQVTFVSRKQAASLDWAGLELNEGREDAGGTFTVPVSYATEAWLFDQILAGAGTIHIAAPQDLRARFISYAQSLL